MLKQGDTVIFKDYKAFINNYCTHVLEGIRLKNEIADKSFIVIDIKDGNIVLNNEYLTENSDIYPISEIDLEEVRLI